MLRITSKCPPLFCTHIKMETSECTERHKMCSDLSASGKSGGIYTIVTFDRQLRRFSSSPSIKWALWGPVHSAVPKLHCNIHPAPLLYNFIRYIPSYQVRFLLQTPQTAFTNWNFSPEQNAVRDFHLGICIKKQEIWEGWRGELYGKNSFCRAKSKVRSLPTCQRWGSFAPVFSLCKAAFSQTLGMLQVGLGERRQERCWNAAPNSEFPMARALSTSQTPPWRKSAAPKGVTLLLLITRLGQGGAQRSLRPLWETIYHQAFAASTDMILIRTDVTLYFQPAWPQITSLSWFC